jgi:CHAD domain-containing protein
MAPKLQPGFSVSEQAHSGIASMLADARGALAAEVPVQAAQVHDARTRIKRIRALLALLNVDLGATRARAEDRALQAAGRALGPLREAGARLDAFDQLSAHAEQDFLAQWRVLLSQDAERTLLLASTKQALGEADTLLGGTQLRVAAWPSATREVAPLARGFQRSYAAGRRAYQAAVRNPSAKALHKLRRRTKRYQYQLQFLDPALSKRLHRRRERAEALSELLGQHHDLVLLGSALADPSSTLGEFASPRMRRALARRERKLRRLALSLARRVYEKRPRLVANQLLKRLHRWQARR